MVKSQFVILAAGKGTRMGNPKIPKVLVMLKNKPLILYLLEEVEKNKQLAKPVVVVGFHAEKVKAVLGEGFLYAEQYEQNGTAHAVLSARKKIKSENILVLYGDMPFIKAESLKELIKLHLKSGRNISMLTTQAENFSGIYKSLEHYGRIIRDINHSILEIVEFKDATQSQKCITEVNPGIYMFKTKWLWDNLDKIKNHNAQKEFYLTDIVAIAISQGQSVKSLRIDPIETLGVNSADDLKIAEKVLVSP